MFNWIWIFGGLFLVGMVLYLVLESEVNFPRPQNHLVDHFKKHPVGFEVIVHALMLTLPVFFSIGFQIFSSPMDEGNFTFILLLIGPWPFIMYMAHRRFREFAFTLGLSSRKGRETDPVLKAKLTILFWIACLVLLIFTIIRVFYDIVSIFDTPIEILTTIVLFILPIRKSVRTLRIPSKDE